MNEFKIQVFYDRYLPACDFCISRSFRAFHL